MPRARLARFAIAAILLALTATGCSTVVSGAGRLVAPSTAPDATLAVVGDGHTSFDRLARNSIADIVAFWKKQFPHIAGGKSLPPLTGKIYSVDDSDVTAGALRNGCLARAGVRVIKDNAFYCTLDDSIAYDRSLDGSAFEARTGIAPPSWPEMIDELYEDSQCYAPR